MRETEGLRAFLRITPHASRPPVRVRQILWVWVKRATAGAAQGGQSRLLALEKHDAGEEQPGADHAGRGERHLGGAEPAEGVEAEGDELLPQYRRTDRRGDPDPRHRDHERHE